MTPLGARNASTPETAKAREEAAAVKTFRAGAERMMDPAETLERLRPLLRQLGITRIANLTGLDTIGVPVVAVHRPNSRSLSVSQGKGVSLIAARVSGLMESIETYHAEHVQAPLFLGSHRELRTRHRFVELERLPLLSTSRFHQDLSMLWTRGTDLNQGTGLLVPYEMVHLDFRLPLPAGSGAFVMGSNGLASGNHLLEALSHGLCELVERDANSLWHVTGTKFQSERALNLTSIDDELCRSVLERFYRADLQVGVWETTTDIGVPSFLCSIVDRDPGSFWPTPPIAGSGCHPRRSIALLRALTEAAQGRLTVISGSRDDLSQARFDRDQARVASARHRALLSEQQPVREFAAAPDHAHSSFDADVQWELQRLAAVGLEQAVAVNLTQPDLGVPVVRVIVPGLETMSELPGYVPGVRARQARRGS
jgi:YcaO-like protein with predicted kinase domain